MEEQKQILAQIEEEKTAQDLPPGNRENPENLEPAGREAVAIDWQMPTSNADDVETDEDIVGLPSANQPKSTQVARIASKPNTSTVNTRSRDKNGGQA